MKKLILLLSFSLFLFPNINFGCSCVSPSSFCESIIGKNGEIHAAFILRGEITESSRSGKEIMVKELLLGELKEKEITLKNGFCTLFYSDLEVGEEYILALREYNDQFFLKDCAISFLKIKNGMVEGKIAPGIETIKYKNLDKLQRCGNAFNGEEPAKNFTVFPNPTTDFVTIENIHPNLSYKNIQLSIIDAMGRVVSFYRKEDGILPEDIWSINLQNLSTGVYIFKLSGDFQTNYFKIIKQ